MPSKRIMDLNVRHTSVQHSSDGLKTDLEYPAILLGYKQQLYFESNYNYYKGRKYEKMGRLVLSIIEIKMILKKVTLK